MKRTSIPQLRRSARIKAYWLLLLALLSIVRILTWPN
jgi:hypothetical protein